MSRKQKILSALISFFKSTLSHSYKKISSPSVSLALLRHPRVHPDQPVNHQPRKTSQSRKKHHHHLNLVNHHHYHNRHHHDQLVNHQSYRTKFSADFISTQPKMKSFTFSPLLIAQIAHSHCC